MASATATAQRQAAARANRGEGRPFFGLIEPVTVDEPANFDFDGSVSRKHASAVWTWVVRDIAPDLIDPEAPEDDPQSAAALITLTPELLERCGKAIAQAAKTEDSQRRLFVQLGGEGESRRLTFVLDALRHRAIIDKAVTFGRAVNGMTDEAVLGNALQSMRLDDEKIASFLLHAAVGQVANPSRLMTAAIRMSDGATERRLVRAGFSPLVEALLAHGQNQLHPLNQIGPFADVDLTCRAIDRFHRLMRAINGYVELDRNSRWTRLVAALTTAVSERVEPKLLDVVIDVNRALRRHRDGHDRLDSDQILSAFNGVYILSTVRDCRDSLALNAVFDQTWNQVGLALEIHIQRNLDLLRKAPRDEVVSARLDAAIKMSELRFNTEYADVLRRAKDVAIAG
jgi:hypothetical protein